METHLSFVVLISMVVLIRLASSRSYGSGHVCGRVADEVLSCCEGGGSDEKRSRSVWSDGKATGLCCLLRCCALLQSLTVWCMYVCQLFVIF